jgi:hypothetical protein
MPDQSAVPSTPPSDGPDPKPAAPGHAPEPPKKGSRDAIVYLPGITSAWGSQSLAGLARRTVAALRRETAGPTFSAMPLLTRPISHASDARTVPLIPIQLAIGAGPGVRVLDVYELNYHDELVRDFVSRSMLERAVQLVVAIIADTPRILYALKPGESGKSRGQRLQIALALGVLCLYGLFLGFLVAGLVTSGLQLVGTQVAGGGVHVAAAAAPLPEPLARVWGGLVDFWGWLGHTAPFVAGVSTLIWVSLKPNAPVRQFITSAATDFLAMDNYLRSGLGRNDLEGPLEDLLDTLREDATYARIHLVGYSFGSIVAMNMMFPPGEPPSPGSGVSAVSTLVTIGCPFDTIRTFWSGYFTGRHASPGKLVKWINIWSPTDALGSNFNNSETRTDADTEVMKTAGHSLPKPVNYLTPGARQSIGALEQAFLAGMAEHGSYWGKRADGQEKTCMDEIVRVLYPCGVGLPGMPVLSTEAA